MSQFEKKNDKDMYYRLIDSYYKPKKLTVEQLREYSGYESVEDDVAMEIINGLYHLSVIIFKNYKKN